MENQNLVIRMVYPEPCNKLTRWQSHTQTSGLDYHGISLNPHLPGLCSQPLATLAKKTGPLCSALACSPLCVDLSDSRLFRGWLTQKPPPNHPLGECHIFRPQVGEVWASPTGPLQTSECKWFVPVSRVYGQLLACHKKADSQTTSPKNQQLSCSVTLEKKGTLLGKNIFRGSHKKKEKGCH